jgi:hypothetical protein
MNVIILELAVLKGHGFSRAAKPAEQAGL